MKTIKILLLLLTLLLISACGDRVPFKAQEPLENAALVYVYVSAEVSTDESAYESDYNIRINNKRTMQRIKEGEYVVFNLKPQPINISATRKQIEEKVLNLDLKAGQIYYLKIKENLSAGAFEFIKVENSLGSKEIVKTGLAGSTVDENNFLTELISPKEEKSAEVKAATSVVAPVAIPTTTPVPATQVSQNISKTDEIQKAYDMKEKGIISDEEFQALKTNILTK